MFLWFFRDGASYQILNSYNDTGLGILLFLNTCFISSFFLEQGK